MAVELIIVPLAILFFVAFLAYKNRQLERRYEGVESVSKIYDYWTGDQMLEYYWGGHLHAGYYGKPAEKKDFISAKNDMVDELFRWGLESACPDLLNRLDKPAGSPVRILDVGCGLGATMRRLGSRWPETIKLTGITLSEGQANRGSSIALEEGINNVAFLQGDALFQTFSDSSFDIVWSLECEPYIHDKKRFIREMVRVLKPGGVWVMGTWNLRDHSKLAPTKEEMKSVQYLLDDWNHAEFISINDWRVLIEQTELADIETADWTAETIMTWRESVLEPYRNPGVLIRTLLTRFVPVMRDGVTLIRYDRAFRSGLMEYGVFRGRKPGNV